MIKISFWDGGRDLPIVLCHSINTGLLVGTLRGDGGHLNPTPTVCLNFMHSEVVGTLKHLTFVTFNLAPTSHPM